MEDKIEVFILKGAMLGWEGVEAITSPPRYH
jgi:hypothetical protein